jgi:Protein of unknown function (DUF4435)
VPAIPRQSIDEIVTKYDFHPELFDVYVEGDFDRDFLCEYFNAIGRRSDVSVYSIDSIDVPSAYVDELGLGHGSNKSRVLALARTLDQKLQRGARNLVCIADADLDRLFGRLCTWPYVHHTDYTCMEMYSLNESSVRRFIRFTCNLDDAAAAEFLGLASSILPTQFCLRGVVEALGVGVAISSFGSGLTTKRDLSTFSKERYLSAFVRTNGLRAREEELRTLFDDLESRLATDIRHKSNGHDFVELLFEFSWLRGGIRLQSKDAEVAKFGARLVSTGVDFRALAHEPLFATLGRQVA